MNYSIEKATCSVDKLITPTFKLSLQVFINLPIALLSCIQSEYIELYNLIILRSLLTKLK